MIVKDLTDFWIVAGTAAPVIALAGAVAIGDSMRVLSEIALWLGEHHMPDRDFVLKSSRNLAAAGAAFAYLAVGAEILALSSALDKFAYGRPSGLAFLGKVPVEYVLVMLGLVSVIGGALALTAARIMWMVFIVWDTWAGRTDKS